MPSRNDRPFMQQALCLARQGLGRVAPNPSVGAVVVQNGRVVGLGRTADGGRPHAEVVALNRAGARAAGATLYVTLEPCAHHGKSPPCTEAIIRAGIARVVVGCRDPFPAVNGSGIAQLQQAGIAVEEVSGDWRNPCRSVNAGFFSVVERNRPHVTLKIASSAEGFIAPAEGVQQWITGKASRRHGHLLRLRHDAILTGIGTVLADDPQLTCRLPGLEGFSPIRIVLDRQNRLPADARLLHDNGPEVWHYTDCGNLPALLEQLAARGVTRLLVEAGNRLNTAFLQAGLVDEIYWYRAPTPLGQGLPALSCPFDWPEQAQRILGADSLTLYRRPGRE